MVTKTIWKKRQGYFWVSAAISSPDTNDSVLNQMTTPLHLAGWAKDVTITFPEGAITMENFCGEDSSGFQNADLVPDPWGMAKMSGTLVLSPTDTDSSLSAFGGSGSGTAITSGETRYQFGGSTAANLRGSKAIAFGWGVARTLVNDAGGWDGTTPLTVDSTAGFPSSGSLIVGTDTSVTYTGKTSTTFTGVSGGSAQADDASVISVGNTMILSLLNNAKFTNPGEATLNGNHWVCSFEAVCLPKDCYLDINAS